jgi:hypothetical protein
MFPAEKQPSMTLNEHTEEFMGRPRKNPDDPKWQTEQVIGVPVNDDWRIFFAAALGGLIARGSGQTYDQMIKTASEIATEAQKSLS